MHKTEYKTNKQTNKQEKQQRNKNLIFALICVPDHLGKNMIELDLDCIERAFNVHIYNK